MQDEPVGLRLRNNGLGPALIVEWTFTINGKVIPEKNRAGLDVVINRYRLDRLTEGMLLTPPSSLAADKTERIIYVPKEFYFEMAYPKGNPVPANAVMVTLLKEVEFRLTYKSVYGDEDTISSFD
jgi:hypothetical protein